MADVDTDNLLCHLYQVLRSDVPSCGCNMPEAADRLVYELVKLAPFYQNERWRTAQQLVGSDGAFQIVISALSDAELLEHGGTMGGSWLGKRGRWFLWAVEQVGGIDGLDERLDEVGYPHDGEGECTEACWAVPEDWKPHINQPGRGPDTSASDTESLVEYWKGLGQRPTQVEVAMGILAEQWGWPTPARPEEPLAPAKQRYNAATKQWEAVR